MRQMCRVPASVAVTINATAAGSLAAVVSLSALVVRMRAGMPTSMPMMMSMALAAHKSNQNIAVVRIQPQVTRHDHTVHSILLH